LCGALLTIAFRGANYKDTSQSVSLPVKQSITQAISLIKFCLDPKLQTLALAYYIVENDYMWLLLETQPFKMMYQFNTDLSVRRILGDA
jgi:hypothetical protein